MLAQVGDWGCDSETSTVYHMLDAPPPTDEIAERVVRGSEDLADKASCTRAPQGPQGADYS